MTRSADSFKSVGIKLKSMNLWSNGLSAMFMANKRAAAAFCEGLYWRNFAFFSTIQLRWYTRELMSTSSSLSEALLS